MSKVTRKPGAVRDLARHAAYLEENASLEVAERFLDAEEHTFEDIAAMPGMGRRRETENPRLKNLRQMFVQGFEKYIVFYCPIEEGVDVIRVLHGARDIDCILEEEDGL